MADNMKAHEHIAMLAEDRYVEDGQPSLIRRKRPQNYKPRAIRLPVLLFFALLLAACAGLIEFVLQKAIKTVDAPGNVTTTTSMKRAEVLHERTPVNDASCTQLPTLTPALASLEKSMSSLCVDFNQSYVSSGTKLYTGRLNSAQVVTFQKWLGSFTPVSSELSRVSERIDFASEDCLYRSQTTYLPWESISGRSVHHMYMGCLTMTMELGCFATGTIYLNSSTISTSGAAWCAESAQNVLTLTSQHPTPSPVLTTPAQVLPTVTVLTKPIFTTAPSMTSSKTSVTQTIVVVATAPSQTPTVTTSSSQSPFVVFSSSISQIITSSSLSPLVVFSSSTSHVKPSSSQSLIKDLSSSTIQVLLSIPSSTPSHLVIPSTESSSNFASSINRPITSATSSSFSEMRNVISQSSISSQTLYTITTQYISVIHTIGANGQPTNVSAIVVAQTVLTTSPGPTTISLPVATASETPAPSSNTSHPFISLSSSEKVINRDVDKFSYVAAIYLPAILAVIIKIMWEIIYAAFKLMEPFNRLSKPAGHLANQTLFAQYLSNSISWDAIKACFSGATLPLLTTIVYAFVTVLAILATSSMTVRATAECEISSGKFMRCNPVWVVNSVILRIIEGLLLICVLLILITIAFTRRYETGVAANPSSIAAVASLINQDALTHDFRLVHPSADEVELKAALNYRRCRLEYHENAKGFQRYGICRVMTSGFYSSSQTSLGRGISIRNWFGGYSAVSNPTASESSHSTFSKNIQAAFLDVLQLLSSAGLFALVTGYRFDFQPDPFNNFFNSGTLQARLIFVAVAAGVDIQWKRLEREVRITEPYRRMAKGFARPETTVLLNLSGTCWSWLFCSLDKAIRFKDMWFQTLVSTVAVLSDINIIAVASVVWSDAQTIPSRDISSYLSMTITSLMTVTMLITMIWWRRGVVSKMPRSPETIGAVYSYLCASRFACAMGTAHSVEELSEDEREDTLIATGWRFSFTDKPGIDGRERWTVDFETAPITHGIPVLEPPIPHHYHH
ncbi:hypothetical protein R6Q59_009963 [Mikania micrantha]